MRRTAALLAPLAALLAAYPSAARAQRQYIDVGSPDFRPLALAIPALQAAPGLQSQANETWQVVRDDLSLTGIFELLDPRSFLADPREGTAAASIRFQRWSDVGAEGLVRVLLRSEGAQLAAELHLYDVRGAREVLFQNLRGSGPRALGHQIADQIVQYYTREPGIFRTRIAAIRRVKGGREIVLVDADGKDPEVVYREAGIVMLPSWRPDGSEILFTSYRGGKPEIWALRLADRSIRPVASLGDLASGAAFSPDGRQVALGASVDGNSDVYVMNADGSDVRRLTSDPATDSQPTWSPDGRRLAFVSTRSGNPHLYVMNADGSDQRRLTFQGNYNQTPRWSPRGDLIAFTARDERKVFDVFVVSPETGKIARVTQDQGLTNEEPSWAANGRLLVFTSDRTGRPQLVVAGATGDKQRLVTSDPAGLEGPAWGPLPR
jgi:TolB protein